MTSDVVEKIRAIGRGLMDPEFALRIFETGWDAQIVVNETGLIQFVNGQAELLFGHPRGEMHDHHINMLLPERLRERHSNFIAGYISCPRMRPMGEMLELKALHRNGNEFDAAIYLVPIIWQDGLFVVATVRRK